MKTENIASGANSVSFKSKGINIAGVLYVPENFDSSKSYEGVVMTPPFPQVKDQVMANYGPKMAERGYVALAFDYNSKGESDSYEPNFRDDENMTRKWEDLRNAISYLGSLSFVEGINGIGFCGGGNIMSSTIITDLRVKAFASVSAMMASDMIQFANRNAFIQQVKAANAARQKMFETGEPVSHDYFGYEDPDYLEKNPDLSGTVAEGYDYYGTGRGGKETYPNFTNVLISTVFETAAINPGEHYADKMIQPYCGIVGSEADTAICTKAFFDKVTSEKEYHEIKGASHVGLYDIPENINKVVEIIDTFFKKHGTI
ncbi:alpha/beta hydrolase [Rubellicoccus peritrichatus]|uniref:Dienelactone hydrolase family protein n=1 Tax=Rubellicoccus peritrichatus TaxID=3080537 RepID=A0AAQ3QV62_9BACT|nr:dienelactone hydrolase family protein [Puniceicoccus sp. CR14]WOO40577.1 dienelactone hydrolase family protein [Puniceicoccus sp. CR14]